MTLKEARKILEKEGFSMASANKVIYRNGAIREFAKPEVCEAIKVANANRCTAALSPTECDEREARLKKEYEELSNAPVPGKGQQEENEKYNLKQIKRLGNEIARLNRIIHKKNLKIEELGKESSRHLEGKIRMFGENVDLEQMLKDKDAVLSDVAEELRLSRIREKNLTEVCRKYMKENGELKEKHRKHVWYKGAQQILDTIADYAAKHPDRKVVVDIAEEGGDHSAVIAQCCKNIAISKDEAELIERCTKNGTELHYSEKDGFTYTDMFGDEMPVICLRGMCQVFTDDEIKNMKK